MPKLVLCLNYRRVKYVWLDEFWLLKPILFRNYNTYLKKIPQLFDATLNKPITVIMMSNVVTKIGINAAVVS